MRLLTCELLSCKASDKPTVSSFSLVWGWLNSAKSGVRLHSDERKEWTG